MEDLLLFIKHHLIIVWKMIEWGNSFAFSILYKSMMEKINKNVLSTISMPPYLFKRLDVSHLDELYNLIHNQNEKDLAFFQAHGFSRTSLNIQLKNPSFLMMGVFDGDTMMGYFFLRFFVNKKSFVGRLIDKEFRGKGIGVTMNRIMYETSWKMGFRCLSTISINNIAVVNSHAKNKHMIVLKKLKNDYLLIEFIRNEKSI